MFMPLTVDGPQHRRPGRGQSRMEAGTGGQADVAGKPPRHLPRRAPPGRCPRAAQHDGARSRFADRTNARKLWARPSPSSSKATSLARRNSPAMMSGLDIHYDLGEGHPLLGRQIYDLDLVTFGWADTGLHADARCPAGAPQPRPRGLLRHRAMGRSGSASRRRSTLVRGSFRRSERSRLPSPCWSGQTDMWPGWEILPVGLTDALSTWFGPAVAQTGNVVVRNSD